MSENGSTEPNLNFKIYGFRNWATNNSCNYIYCLTSQKLVQELVQKLVPGLFLKNQNQALLCINSPKFDTVCFYCMSRLMAIKRY